MISVTGRTWKVLETDLTSVTSLARRFNIHEVVARLLLNRGISETTAENYLFPKIRHFLPDSSLLIDLDKAVARSLEAIEKKEKIVIYADYDVDGATSAALFLRYFKEIDVPIHLYIPDRLTEGYGLNEKALDVLKHKGVNLIILVDSGTVSFKALEKAKLLNLDVIVLDHHLPQSTLPEAFALVNPNRKDQILPPPFECLKYLCAAGVSFLFLIALQRALRTKTLFNKPKEPNLLSYLDLVALGTVCDVMPLVGLNRAFVAQGIRVAAKMQNMGLAALLKVSGIKSIESAYHFGFIVGPRINAGGRVGESKLGAQLLSTLDQEKASEIALQLNTLNQRRQEIEYKVFEEAVAQVQGLELDQFPIIMVKGDHWHPGVIGIVASRLKDRFNKPIFVVSFEGGIGKGSARSILTINLEAIIHQSLKNKLILQGGGHAMAAGFTLEETTYTQFYDFLKNFSQTNSEPISLTLDTVLSFQGTKNFHEHMKFLEPFGTGNLPPKFLFKNIRILSYTLIGKNHISAQLSDKSGIQLRGIAFHALNTPIQKGIQKGIQEPIHIAGSLKTILSDHKKIQIVIEDILSAQNQPITLK